MAGDLKNKLRTWQQLARLYGLRLHRAEEAHRRASEKLRHANGERDAVAADLASYRSALRRANADFVTVTLERPMDAKAHLAHIVMLGHTRESLVHQLAAAAAEVDRQRVMVQAAQRVLNAAQGRVATVKDELRRLSNAWTDRVEEQER